MRRTAKQESQNEASADLDCKDFYEFGYRPQKIFKEGKKKNPQTHVFEDEWNPCGTSADCFQLINTKLL